MSRVLRSDVGALLSIAAGGLLCGQFVAPTALHILGKVDPAAEVLEVPSEASALHPVRLRAPVQSEAPAFPITRWAIEGSWREPGLTSHSFPVPITVTNTRLRWLSSTYVKP